MARGTHHRRHRLLFAVEASGAREAAREAGDVRVRSGGAWRCNAGEAEVTERTQRLGALHIATGAPETIAADNGGHHGAGVWARVRGGARQTVSHARCTCRILVCAGRARSRQRAACRAVAAQRTHVAANRCGLCHHLVVRRVEHAAGIAAREPAGRRRCDGATKAEEAGRAAARWCRKAQLAAVGPAWACSAVSKPCTIRRTPDCSHRAGVLRHSLRAERAIVARRARHRQGGCWRAVLAGGARKAR